MRRGKVVSFRVAEEHYQLLMARSAQGGSPGSLARELMLQALHSDSVVEEFKSHFDQQRIALTDLQSSLFRAFRAALVIFGKFGSKQAADASQKILGNALEVQTRDQWLSLSRNLRERFAKRIDEILDIQAAAEAVRTSNPSAHRPRNLTPDDERILAGLSRLVAEKYGSRLTNLLEIGGTARLGHASEGYLFLNTVQTNASGPSNLVATISATELASKPFVYTVEPKQFAQNLSDAATREVVRSFAAQLAAAMPQAGAKIGAFANYVQRSQYFLETIKRIPLVTSFAGQEEFGWVIGPRIRVTKDAELSWEQIPVQYSMQATIAVPAWWTDLEVNAQAFWLDDDGNESPITAGHPVNVRLDPNLESLTAAFSDPFDRQLIGPLIYPEWNSYPTSAQFNVQPRRPAELLILGRNLWRNPEVFIGSQGTRDVSVLPDMAGIVARFAEVRPPALTPADGDAYADLRVVTSGGQAVLKNGVRIVSYGSAETKAAVRLVNRFAISGKKLEVEADAKLTPAGYAGFQLLMAPPGGTLREVGELQPAKDGKITFTVPTSAPWDAANEIKLDVQLKLTPDQFPRSVLENGAETFVLFANENQAAFKLSKASVDVISNSKPDTAPISINITPPDTTTLPRQELFWKAYPDLKTQLEGKSAQLRLKKGEKVAIIPTNPFSSGAASINLDHALLTKSLGPSTSGDDYEATLIVSGGVFIPAGKITMKATTQP